jgi:transcriptional regulator with XRE-family HTH domain
LYLVWIRGAVTNGLTNRICIGYGGLMTLKEWLAQHRMSDAQFARLSGIGQRALIQKYRHGRQFPAPENLRRIKRATAGAVTADDFVDHVLGAETETTVPSAQRSDMHPPEERAAPAIYHRAT